MSEVTYLDKKYPLKRIIAKYEWSENETAIIFIGGMHGNEVSGYAALNEVVSEIEQYLPKFKGNFYALGGNLQAMRKNVRYIDRDLNRIWLNQNINRILQGEINHANAVAEEKEFLELYLIIKEVMDKHREVYVIDLHTTSADSIPFITINDMLINRNFSMNFPLPIILGIEEYLTGPLLSYMNEFNHVSMAFEAGQHTDPKSIKINESFVWLSLVFAGIIDRNDLPTFEQHYNFLKAQTTLSQQIFEVRYRKDVKPQDHFVMNKGYVNFSPINHNETLANDVSGEVKSIEGGRIFMPLYQNQGSDGFFIIRKVPRWALKASKTLRKINFERFLTLLPGVRHGKNDKHLLVVNKKIARFLNKEIFHLLGYRRKQEKDTLLIFSRREIGEE